MDEFGTIDLREILYILKKKFKIILLSTIIVTLIVGIYSLFIVTPMYEATVSVYIGKMDTADTQKYNDIILSNQLIGDYKELLGKPKVKELAKEKLIEQNLNPDDYISKVNVTLKKDTRWIDLTAVNKKPDAAKVYANIIADVFAEQSKEMVMMEHVNIYDYANTPTEPVSPNIKLNILIGVLAGLAIGTIIVFVLYFIDNKVRTTDDIKRRYKQIPIIGSVPDVGMDDNDTRKVLLTDDGSAFESYRYLRTNIMFSSMDKMIKTILVTSTVPGEGKTKCAVNLAVAFAKAGNRTLLIDADLRRPRVHRYFDINTVKGLTSALVTDIEIERVIKANVIENLDILPAGIKPPNPAELITSEALKIILSNISVSYDIVIIDSPPVGIFTDATVLSKLADGAVYVVSTGMATYKEINSGVENLQNVNANILGFAVTRVEMDVKERDYYDDYSRNDKR